MGEYQAKADRMDTLLGEAGGGGRVRRQLDLFGELITVVVGKYNELSEGGHMLLEAMASSRAALVERRTGMARQDVKSEKGIIQGELRRQLSVVNLRASMSCMLDRLHQSGEGGSMEVRSKSPSFVFFVAFPNNINLYFRQGHKLLQVINVLTRLISIVSKPIKLWLRSRLCLCCLDSYLTLP